VIKLLKWPLTECPGQFVQAAEHSVCGRNVATSGDARA
jgi:hypothetical protein